MWHEARKQERKIRGMLVDLKKRAERRKEFYERIKQDPAQFLQLHGRRCRIHIDPAIAQAADSPAAMMPWQGHPDVLIDRFDVRAHLDTIPEYKAPTEAPALSDEQREEERQANYERYRTLVQNDFLGVNEDKFLHQIYLEERYGPVGKPIGTTEDEKKKLAEKKAAIGYVYEDSTPVPSTSSNQNEEEEEEDKEDLSDIDLDIAVNVNELNTEQATEMNTLSLSYGMESTDFISFLHLDKEEQERLKLARELEEEKAMYSGRKSRRERRALREKKLKNRIVTSPPSYAARESPTYKPFRAQSSSRSRSRSPQNAGEITFITSFGSEASDEEDGLGTKKKGAAGKQAGAAMQVAHSGTSSHSGRPSSSKSGRQQDNNHSSRSKPRERSRSRERYGSSSRSANRNSRPSRRTSSRSRSRSRSLSPTGHGRRVRRRSRSWARQPQHKTQRGGGRNSRSRSRSWHRRNRWRSSSRSRSRSKQRGARRMSPSPGPSRGRRSRSRSPTPPQQQPPRKLPSPPRKSYYRHSLSRSRSRSSDSGGDRKSRSQSSERSSEESRGQAAPSGANGARRTWPTADTLRTNVSVGKPGPASKGAPVGLTPREKLKRKMQAALNKQYKADKRAEREKQDKIQQERWDRAEELRGMAIRLRQRERERRHRERDDYDYDPDDSRDGREGYSSRSASGSPSRSRSQSPEPRPPGETAPSLPGSSRGQPHYSRRRSRSLSRSPPPQEYYRSRPQQQPSWSSRGLVDY